MRRTHYQNLQIREEADPAVIKASYKALAMRYHPDRNPDDVKEAERIFRIITAAYEVLSDPAERLKYDANLRAEREQATAAQPQTVRAPNAPTKAPAQAEQAQKPATSSVATAVFTSRIASSVHTTLKRISSNPRVPRPIRWLLDPPWRLVLICQIVIAAYLFRNASLFF